jgi:hypothetical protein
MDVFIHAIAVVSAICLGIFAVSIFLTFLGFLKDRLRGTNRTMRIPQDFIKKDSMVTVKISGGEIIERLKFIGYTTSKNKEKDPIPFRFHDMAVFENDDHEKIFIPTLSIQYFKELPATAPSTSL